jgi:hypothetical protein
MKFQLSAQRMRLRIDETELDRLLHEGVVEDTTVFAPEQRYSRRLRLDEIDAPELWSGLRPADAALTIVLPRSQFEAFASARPRRDGFEFAWQAAGIDPLRVVVEIDVRDSHRQARSDGSRS